MVETPPSSNTPITSNAGYLSGQMIEVNFRGKVTDQNGAPIVGADVRIGTAMTSTNEEGIFQFLNVSVDSQRAYVSVSKAGYFTSGRVIVPSTIGFNRAMITLIETELTGSVMSANGGEVTHSSGAKVNLPADGFVDEQGNAYSGSVDVHICYLDPEAEDFLDITPGDLTALEEDGDFVALISYGMIGVELMGSSGQSLQIADGLEAEISVPLPSSGNPPATIPLWHFDEEEDVWKEEGEASIDGDSYVIIGNFYRDEETQMERLDSGKDGAYYYLDHVMLRRAMSGESLSPAPKTSRAAEPPVVVEEFASTEEVEIEEIQYDVGISIELKNIQFEFDQAELLPSSQDELDKLAFTMIDNPHLMIKVVGHSDNVGDESYNQALSEQRAQAVVAYLIHREVEQDRLEFEGLGSIAPRYSNDTEEGREANRRVEFTIISN